MGNRPCPFSCSSSSQIGFWDTFAAILGGVAMLVLFVLLAIILVVLAGILLVRRLRRPRAL
jgi:hypothetical protein